MKTKNRAMAKPQRTGAAFLLSGLLVWSCAADLGSETLTLVTTYPSPMGVYKNILTTSRTILSRNVANRDGGGVMIGSGNPGARLTVEEDAGSACQAGGTTCFSPALNIRYPGSVGALISQLPADYNDYRGNERNAVVFANFDNADMWFGTNNRERMRITKDGMILINTPGAGGPNDTGSPILQVQGISEFYAVTKNQSGVWNTLSDERLKRDIQPMTGALETLLKLRGVSFRWKDAKKDALFGRVRGFIAQEVERAIPEWVRTGKDGYKSIETVGVDALLVEAIKEQQKQISELRDENRRLAAEIRGLSARR